MINYDIINQSIAFYEEKGFQRIESPWLVTEAVDIITRPEGVIPYKVESKNKNLVASGEQSFLYLYLKGFLPKGCFQTITPCFRSESFDFTHSKYFMKNELIETKCVNDERLKEITKIALEFFQIFLPESVIIPVENGYDIMWREYELGSYGIRDCEFLEWIYATGCAEPRLSKLIKLRNELS